MLVRDATAADAAACAALYAPFVRDTAVSFEDVAPDAAEVAARIAAAHAWLVAVDGAELAGYAYAGPFRARPAYARTCETSVYVARDRQRSGVGRALYGALLERVAALGSHTAVAVMTLPNDGSAALHTGLGFEPVGVLREVGWKHGRWHDVALYQRVLATPPGP